MDAKTNAIRILEKNKIPYTPHAYDANTALNGVQVAQAVGIPCGQVFKTLVTVGKSKKNYVFVIPVREELDLKKAAAVTGEKSIEMLPQKELLPLTGYIHGGCSPVGMKKLFPTVLHRTAEKQDTIACSAGKAGLQMELTPQDLHTVVPFIYADVIVNEGGRQ